MTNVLDEESVGAKLYNKEIKGEFLSEYEQETQMSYKRVFEYSYKFERLFGKDLFDFDSGEIADVLCSLHPLTGASSRTNGRIVSAYIYWSIEKGYCHANENPLFYADNEWFDKFVNPSIMLYLSDSQIENIEDFCENAQDACIIRAIFEGVAGKGVSELVNLRKQDVDMITNTLFLRDENGKSRILEVSDRCIKMLKQAIQQREYVKKNGYVEDANIALVTRLVTSDYILRNSITQTIRYENVDVHTIYRRLSVIKDMFQAVRGEDAQFLSVKNIAKSGMIYEGFKVFKKQGELTKEDYVKIANRYKINIWSRLKDFVNQENIRTLYGGEL